MTKKYGIIGCPLTHSFSKKYFNEKFEKENISNTQFENYELQCIDALQPLLLKEQLLGFCVTIPYKKEIIPFLDALSPEVLQMGACNCVKVEKNGQLKGYNTDVLGFEKSFQPLLQPHHQKALVLGSGGAAAAVIFVLEKLQIDYRIVSRTAQEQYLTYEALTPAIMETYHIIINTTPLGTFPKVDTAPNIPYHLLTPQHYLYDLVYNPPLTQFLERGKQHGAIIKNGYEMLLLQAEENWHIWSSG